MNSHSRLTELRRRLARYMRSARGGGLGDIAIHDELREIDQQRAEELVRDQGWDRLRDKS